MAQKWTFNDGFNKGLSESGKATWLVAYNSGIRFISKNVAGFTRNTTLFFDEIAALRNKKGPNTRLWNPKADQIGLAGELVVLKYMGFSAEEALELFLQGLKGDNGWDFKAQEWRVDVKTTTTSNAQFRFNRNNKHQAQANAYCLVHMQTQERSGLETFRILGWAPKHKMKPYFHPYRKDSDRVFATSLMRDGILREIGSLKDIQDMNNQEGAL